MLKSYSNWGGSPSASFFFTSKEKSEMNRNGIMAGGLAVWLAAGTAAAPAAQPVRSGPPEEKTSVTHHSARIGGQQITHTATAGTYVVKADDGTPKATLFYVAYTKDDVPDISKRPMAFVYNGGPGSASLFTHMGLGPKRIVLTDDGHGMPAPYSMVDNEESFLDAASRAFRRSTSRRPTCASAPSAGSRNSSATSAARWAAWIRVSKAWT
jgi:hypothetical protein